MLAHGTVVCLVVAYAVFLRSTALDPPALWFDDAWVALSQKATTIRELLLVNGPSPILFTLIIRTLRSFVADPELSAQLFPFICGIAIIPLSFLLVSRVTSSYALGVVAAALNAVAPVLAEYSTRVKHYTSDALTGVVLLILFAGLCRRPQESRLSWTALVACLGSLLSYTSILVSGLFLHLVVAYRFLQRRNENHVRSAGTVLGFDLFVATYYWFVVRPRNNSALRAFWAEFFIVWQQDLWVTCKSILAHLAWAIGGAFPRSLAARPGLVIILLLMAAGTWSLCRSKTYGLLGLTFLLFYPSLVVLASLSLYPLGGGRTDAFSHPISIFLALNGIRVPLKWLRAQFVVSAAAALLLLMAFGNHILYPNEGSSAEFVSRIEREAGDQDGLVVDPTGNFAFAYYTTWPISFRKNQDGTGFGAELRRRNALLIPSERLQSAQFSEQLEEFLFLHWRKVYYFVCHAHDQTQKAIVDSIARRFRLLEEWPGQGCLVEVFVSNEE